MDLLKQIMQMVLSLIELGKILFHYSCYKHYFMLPSTLRQRNTFLFERLTIHHSTPTPFVTTHKSPIIKSYLK